MEIFYRNPKLSPEPACILLIDAEAGMVAQPNLELLTQLNCNQVEMFSQVMATVSYDMSIIGSCSSDLALARRLYFRFPDSRTIGDTVREFVEEAVAA